MLLASVKIYEIARKGMHYTVVVVEIKLGIQLWLTHSIEVCHLYALVSDTYSTGRRL